MKVATVVKWKHGWICVWTVDRKDMDWDRLSYNEQKVRREGNGTTWVRDDPTDSDKRCTQIEVQGDTLHRSKRRYLHVRNCLDRWMGVLYRIRDLYKRRRLRGKHGVMLNRSFKEAFFKKKNHPPQSKTKNKTKQTKGNETEIFYKCISSSLEMTVKSN